MGEPGKDGGGEKGMGLILKEATPEPHEGSFWGGVKAIMERGATVRQSGQ